MSTHYFYMYCRGREFFRFFPRRSVRAWEFFWEYSFASMILVTQTQTTQRTAIRGQVVFF